MTIEGPEVRIGLMGPSKAGKSNMFQTFHEALDRGRHGFPRDFDPQVQPLAEPVAVEALSDAEFFERMINQADPGDIRSKTDRAFLGDIPATELEDIDTRHYRLSYRKPEGRQGRTSVRMVITDAAGEHSFARRQQDETSRASRMKLYDELAKCAGFVVVVPLSTANDSHFITRLETWLQTLDKKAPETQPGQSALPRPVVIALTRYDALFTEFGCEAFRIAAEPRVVTDVVNRVVEGGGHGASYKRNIAKYDVSEGGRFKIVFVPTSSFGFLPGFGCVNLDPDINRDVLEGAVQTGDSPMPFKVQVQAHRGQHLFPFLTADPFIYAATGIANPYFVSIQRAKHQKSYDSDDRTAWLRAPQPEPDAETMRNAGQAHSEKPAGAGSAHREEQPQRPKDGGWKRGFRNFVRRFDLDL